MNQQDLENLQQEIAIAQKQLNEIVAATNREVITQQELVAEIAILQQNKLSAVNATNATTASRQQAEDELAIVTQTLNGKRSELEKTVETARIDLETIKSESEEEKAVAEKTVQDKKKEIADLEESARARLVSINNDIEEDNRTLSMLKSEIAVLQQQKNDTVSQTQQIIAQGEDANNAVKARQENLMAIDGRVHALRYEEQQLTISIQNKTAERSLKDQELGSVTLDIESLK